MVLIILRGEEFYYDPDSHYNIWRARLCRMANYCYFFILRFIGRVSLLGHAVGRQNVFQIYKNSISKGTSMPALPLLNAPTKSE